MAMNLPLPKVLSDVQPGGGIYTTYNALTQNALANRKQEIENQYSPITKQAEAASKLAYANLMGPQFLAKVMGNENLLANLTPQQQQAGLQKVFGAGSGSGTGMGSGMNFGGMVQPSSSPAQKVINYLGQQLGFGGDSTRSNNAFNAPMSAPQQQAPMQQPTQASQPQPSGPASVNSGYAYDQNGNNVRATPQEVTNAANGQSNPPAASGDFATTAGDFAGRKQQRIEEGRLRAKQEGALSDENKAEANKLNNLQEMGNIVTSPVYDSIRQIPIAEQHEIGFYSRFGTPEQKNLLGNFFARSGEIVQQAASGFKGSFRGFENSLISSMKPSANDMPDVARGKVQSLLSMAKFNYDRNKLAENLMRTQNMDQSDAFDAADKAYKGTEIRKQLENQFKPTIKIKNSKGEQRTVTLDEARRLGVPNV